MRGDVKLCVQLGDKVKVLRWVEEAKEGRQKEVDATEGRRVRIWDCLVSTRKVGRRYKSDIDVLVVE